MNTNNQNPYIIPGAVVVAALIIAAAIIYGPTATTGNAIDPETGEPTPAVAATVNAKDVDITGDPFIGKIDAPLTIVYWSDFQCPFCKKFDEETLSKVVPTYVDTGKVKLVFKDFQFLGPDSFTMGLAARAIWEAYPDKYYAWREALFARVGDEHSGYATPQFMSSVIKAVPGIDEAKINALIKKNKAAYEAAMEADKQEGGKFGISGTPGIIAGNERMSGAVAYPTFSAKLEAQLK